MLARHALGPPSVNVSPALSSSPLSRMARSLPGAMSATIVEAVVAVGNEENCLIFIDFLEYRLIRAVLR